MKHRFIPLLFFCLFYCQTKNVRANNFRLRKMLYSLAINSKPVKKIKKIAASPIMQKTILCTSFMAGLGSTFCLYEPILDNPNFISIDKKTGRPKTPADRRNYILFGIGTGLISILLGNFQPKNQFFNNFVTGSFITSAIFSNISFMAASPQYVANEKLKTMGIGLVHAGGCIATSSKHRKASLVTTLPTGVILSSIAFHAVTKKTN